MPNWMTVSLTADTTNEPNFDFSKDFTSFNDIVPMPKALRKTVSRSVSHFVEKHYEKGLSWLLHNRSEYDKVLTIARIYRARQLTGYFEWYTWSCEHWGAKWDMDVSVHEKHNIVFKTPWCIPIPMIEALGQKFPKVEFAGEFAEEQDGYYTGTLSILEGQCYIDADIEFSNDAYERYFSLCGGREFYDFINGKYVLKDD